jgi:hypothetical protein
MHHQNPGKRPLQIFRGVSSSVSRNCAPSSSSFSSSLLCKKLRFSKLVQLISQQGDDGDETRDGKRLLVHFGVHLPLKNPNDKIEGKFWANICTSVPRGVGRGAGMTAHV